MNLNNNLYPTTNYSELYLNLLEGIKSGVSEFNTENITLLTEKLTAVVTALGSTNDKLDSLATKIDSLATQLASAVTSLSNIDVDLDPVKESLGNLEDIATSIHANTSNIDSNVIQGNLKLDQIVTNTTPSA